MDARLTNLPTRELIERLARISSLPEAVGRLAVNATTM